MRTRRVHVASQHEGMYLDAMAEISEQCLDCRHFRADPFGCTAFPGGIPERILNGGHDHTKPFPGDKGIRYEKA